MGERRTRSCAAVCGRGAACVRRRAAGVRLGVPECGRVHNSNHHDRADQNFGLNTCN